MSLPPHNPARIDGWVAVVPDLPADRASVAAVQAAALAAEMAPKVSGRGARGLRPASGEGWFGIWSAEPHMVHQNEGTRPRVMASLAGKTIPMWITDEDGSMTAGIPLVKQGERTRVTADGRRQVLIFRKAAPIGSTKTVVLRSGRYARVPRAYPGAPKRVGGRFAGVHWRHPGLRDREFAQDALVMTAMEMNLDVRDLYPSRIGV